MKEFFQVAIDDERRAKEAVRIAAKLANSALVKVEGELSSTEIGWLSLQPGEARSVRRMIAESEHQGRRTRR